MSREYLIALHRVNTAVCEVLDRQLDRFAVVPNADEMRKLSKLVKTLRKINNMEENE